MDSATMSALVGVFAALAGAAVGGYATWVVHVRAQKEQRLRDLREVMLQIHDHRIRMATEVNPIPDDDQRRNLLVMYNSRLSTLRTIAESLVPSVSDQLTFSDLQVLGEEYQSSAEYGKAYEYYTRAVAATAAAGGVDQVTALRYLAGLYYIQASYLYNPALGDQTYLRAVAVTRHSDDQWLRFTTGWTFLAWAGDLARIGDERWLATAMEARSCYASLPDDFYYKASELQNLDRWVASASSAYASGEQVEPPMQSAEQRLIVEP